jgi:HSP20 family molecular chaperone IbpA
MLTLTRRPVVWSPWTLATAPNIPVRTAPATAWSRAATTGYGSVRVARDGQRVTYRFDVPGTLAEDVIVEVIDGILQIAATRSDDRSVARFERRLTLPRGTDANAVSADLRDGVLAVVITLPEAPQPSRVAITIGSTPATVAEEAEEAEGAETPPPTAAAPEAGDLA